MILLQQEAVILRVMRYMAGADFCACRATDHKSAMIYGREPFAIEMHVVFQINQAAALLKAPWRDSGLYQPFGRLLTFCATLSTTDAVDIFMCIIKLSQRLRELHLAIAQAVAEDQAGIFQERLCQCVDLRILELRNVRGVTSTPCSKFVSAAIAALPQLSKIRSVFLQWQFSRIGVLDWARLRQWIASTPKLERLELSGAEISPHIVQSLPSLVSLVDVNLSNNLRTFDRKADALAELMSSCLKLRSLSLSLNALRSKDIEKLCGGLLSSSKLYLLDLSHNFIYQWGAEQLLDTLQKLRTTRVMSRVLNVDLRYNAIDDPTLITKLHDLQSHRIRVDVRHCEDPDGEGRDLDEIINEERSRT